MLNNSCSLVRRDSQPQTVVTASVLMANSAASNSTPT